MHRLCTRSRARGFTLIEILIVVIILGILAAIVIPQFSSASQDARKSSLQSNVQTLRSQVALYQLQHNGVLPGSKSGTFDSATFWNEMTMFSDVSGNTNATGSTTFAYGPYMQSTPANALNTNSTVIDGSVAPPGSAASACGYEYDFTGATGRVYGTDVDGTTLLP